MSKLVAFQIITKVQNINSLASILQKTTTEYSNITTTRILQSNTEMCLTFLFEPEDLLMSLDTSDGLLENKISIGCIWTGFKIGTEYLIMTASSATSGMAAIFEESTNIRNLFIKIAQESSAELLLFLDDWNQSKPIWQQKNTHKNYTNPARNDVDMLCINLLTEHSIG